MSDSTTNLDHLSGQQWQILRGLALRLLQRDYTGPPIGIAQENELLTPYLKDMDIRAQMLRQILVEAARTVSAQELIEELSR